MENKNENRTESTSEMTELNPEELKLASGGGPNISATLLKLKQAVRSNRTLWKYYQKLDDEMSYGDCTEDVVLEELIWGRMGIPMKYDWENDRILFGGFDDHAVWTLDQVLGRLRSTKLGYYY